MSYVYFIGCQNCAGEMRVKIGFTRRNPLERLFDFQPGSPEELDVLSYLEGSMDDEKALHRRFAAQRLHNEWFLVTGSLEVLVRHLMCHGRGARAPTEQDVFWAAWDLAEEAEAVAA